MFDPGERQERVNEVEELFYKFKENFRAEWIDTIIDGTKNIHRIQFLDAVRVVGNGEKFPKNVAWAIKQSIGENVKSLGEEYSCDKYKCMGGYIEMKFTDLPNRWLVPCHCSYGQAVGEKLKAKGFKGNSDWVKQMIDKGHYTVPTAQPDALPF